MTGYFNRSLETNPMKNWNYIFIRYCDGWSFAGNVEEPQAATITNQSTKVTSNVTVWLRGRAILDAVIADLLTVRGMQTATNVVVGGCSAGGMAVYVAFILSLLGYMVQPSDTCGLGTWCDQIPEL